MRRWIRYRRAGTALGAGVAAAALAAGCSATAGFGGPPAVRKATVQSEVASSLAKTGRPAPKVSCPKNLPATVGTVMYCQLTAAGSAAAYPVQVKVTSTSGNKVNFHIHVSTTPGRYTA